MQASRWLRHDTETPLSYKPISCKEELLQEGVLNATLALYTYRSLERASTRSFCCRRPSMSSSVP